MSLHLGKDFSVRWKHASTDFKQQILSELQSLTDLLDSKQDIQTWEQYAQTEFAPAFAEIAHPYVQQPAPDMSPSVSFNVMTTTPPLPTESELVAQTTTPLNTIELLDNSQINNTLSNSSQINNAPLPQAYLDYIDAQLQRTKNELQQWLHEQLHK